MRRSIILLSIILTWISWVSAQNPDLASSYYHFSLARMYELNEDFAKALDEYDKALKADPQSVSLRIEYSRSLWIAGKADQAEKECLKAIEMDSESVEAHHLLGKIYFNSQKEDMDARALEQFEKVIELDPNQTEALFDAAQIELKNRNYESAASYFGRVRQLNPSSVRAFYYGAQALLAAKKRGEALKVLEEGLVLSRNIPDYLILLGQLYEQEGMSDKAAEIFRMGLEQTIDPRLMEGLVKSLMSLGESEEAIQYLRRLLKVYPQRLELKLELAKALRMGRRLDEARVILEEILESVPSHIEASYELGRIESMIGYQEKAIERFESLVSSTKNEAQKFFKSELAIIYADVGRYEEAIQLLSEVYENSTDDDKAGLRLFYTYKQASLNRQALELAESLVLRHPDDTYINMAYAQALASNDRIEEATDLLLERMEKGDDAELMYGAIAQLFVSRSEFPKAQEWVEEGLSQFPENDRLRFQLGAVLERQKDFENAEIEFKKILADTPDDAEVLNYLGYMLTERDLRLEEALEYIERAVELDPYNAAFLDSLGWVYFKKNRYKEAEEYLIKAARINDSDPVILEHLGDLYQVLGTPDKARYYYEQSLQFAENQEESERVQQKLEQLLASAVN